MQSSSWQAGRGAAGPGMARHGRLGLASKKRQQKEIIAMEEKNSPESHPDRWVVVTTSFGGVFFGRVEGDATSKEKIVLRDCRCALYWAGKSGWLGLASHGPEESSKLGAVAKRVLLHEISAVADCSECAEKVWREWR